MQTWILKSDVQIDELITYCNSINLECKKLDDRHLYVGKYNIDKNILNKIDIIDDKDQYYNYINHDNISANVSSTFTPLQLASIYKFPIGNGTGQKIGIIELGGGYARSDITTYLHNLGITDTTNIIDVSVNGAQNNPGLSDDDMEVVLDLEIIVSLVPKAEIRMYFAPNSISGFYNAILTAINDGCKIISISWGLRESGYGNTNLTNFNNLFLYATQQGVTILVASGDAGSSDGGSGLNVDFPSSSPYVVACGGTTLIANNNVRVSETVWNNNSSSAGGGGISSFFSKPSYQNDISILTTKRGVPDIAANANPNTGYQIYYRGQNVVVGGTSAVAPLISALLGRINQVTSTNVGFINQLLYNNKSVCYDVISGNNGFYNAGTSYDCCSGIGVIDAERLLNLFIPTLPTASFTYIINNLSVNFTNTSVNGTTYLWNFGDSVTSTLTSPSHTYLSSGNYNVSLQATNTNGTNTVSHAIIVSTLYADFTWQIVSRLKRKVQFNASSNNVTYKWGFQNYIFSTVKNPTLIFNRSGTYNITLTIIKNNVSSTITKQIVV
jgi:PKD repeat protein